MKDGVLTEIFDTAHHLKLTNKQTFWRMQLPHLQVFFQLQNCDGAQCNRADIGLRCPRQVINKLRGTYPCGKHFQVKLSMYIYHLFQCSSLPQIFLLTLQLSYKFSHSWI